jgi:sterol desaturase/sphingolipid hydroxylase (fatty acid hydroxylase superfamily)
MEKFLLFWDTITTWQRLLTILAPLIFFWILEYIIPLINFTAPYKKVKHTGVNLVFLGTSFIVNILLGMATIAVSKYVTTMHIGIFQWIKMPVWATVIIALFVMDLFAQYIPHYLLHKVKFLWRFHVVHHSDTHVDVSTGTRHHPGEWIIRESFTIIGVIVLGLPIGLYFMHRSFQALFTYFNHANIQLPKWLDKTIGLVFVSPDMHKFHHHYKRPWTDMNFANSFSIWDRLFGTLVYDDVTAIRYGIDTLDSTLDEDVLFQLTLPFNPLIKVSVPENAQ